MSNENFSAEVVVTAKPEAVYTAITREIDKWWTELSHPAPSVGDLMTVRFEGTTAWVMRVVEAVPNRVLSWKVMEAHHDLSDIAKKDEWQGTWVQWRIAETDTGSRVTLTHRGLVPKLACYDICVAGWGYFLGSLKSYLETGSGYPYRPSAEGEPS